MERRALRRAADQALLTSLGNAAPSFGGGPADQDFEYSEPAEEHHEPVTEPIPVAVHGLSYDWPDVEVPADPGGELPPPSPPVPAEPRRDHGYVPPALDFAVSAYRGQRWYRTKPATAALIAAVLVAIASGGWLLFRNPETAVRPSSIEAPTSAAPTLTTAPPTAVSAPKASPAPPPAPPPPPPPPPAGRTYSPSQQQYSPRYSEPTQEQKPRVDVTRAPMSVAPVPRPVPGSGSSTPGDAPDRDSGGRRRGCFGFC